MYSSFFYMGPHLGYILFIGHSSHHLQYEKLKHFTRVKNVLYTMQIMQRCQKIVSLSRDDMTKKSYPAIRVAPATYQPSYFLNSFSNFVWFFFKWPVLLGPLVPLLARGPIKIWTFLEPVCLEI